MFFLESFSRLLQIFLTILILFGNFERSLSTRGHKTSACLVLGIVGNPSAKTSTFSGLNNINFLCTAVMFVGMNIPRTERLELRDFSAGNPWELGISIYRNKRVLFSFLFDKDKAAVQLFVVVLFLYFLSGQRNPSFFGNSAQQPEVGAVLCSSRWALDLSGSSDLFCSTAAGNRKENQHFQHFLEQNSLCLCPPALLLQLSQRGVGIVMSCDREIEVFSHVWVVSLPIPGSGDHGSERGEGLDFCWWSWVGSSETLLGWRRGWEFWCRCRRRLFPWTASPGKGGDASRLSLLGIKGLSINYGRLIKATWLYCCF
ncbi:uncharacterized protein LOC117244924 [Parus major]|uniref:uncharacterized protein LOC117244924 n=1 Tax=Parus major TaxID=9157 RepID=UPI0014445F12|nr:uncharacterized protein LOC117244924 [Parus major]